MKFDYRQRKAVALALNKLWPKLPRIFQELSSHEDRALYIAVELDDFPGDGMRLSYDPKWSQFKLSRRVLKKEKL